MMFYYILNDEIEILCTMLTHFNKGIYSELIRIITYFLFFHKYISLD